MGGAGGFEAPVRSMTLAEKLAESPEYGRERSDRHRSHLGAHTQQRSFHNRVRVPAGMCRLALETSEKAP